MFRRRMIFHKGPIPPLISPQGDVSVSASSRFDRGTRAVRSCSPCGLETSRCRRPSCWFLASLHHLQRSPIRAFRGCTTNKPQRSAVITAKSDYARTTRAVSRGRNVRFTTMMTACHRESVLTSVRCCCACGTFPRCVPARRASAPPAYRDRHKLATTTATRPLHLSFARINHQRPIRFAAGSQLGA